MRILFADSNHSILHETLMKAGHQCDLFWDKPAAELIALLPVYDGLVIRSKFRLTESILSACTRLKCIGRVGAGMENIDVDYALSRQIVCLSAPEGNRDAVGEHALGMLLMLLNNLKKADAEVRRGTWLRAENRGYEIAGKTVGIIGYGQMGSSFARKLSGFDCNVLAYDKYKSGFGNAQVNEAGLQQLFGECDILSIHLPLTQETEFMIDGEFLQNFNKSIYLINTARGKCLRTADLVNLLESGKVKGACLDVLEYESISFESIDDKDLPEAYRYLVQSDKVILSPHIAGWTHESNYKMSRIIAEKMVEALSAL
jgi:D-3-phosphoglycerate dehydrogenase